MFRLLSLSALALAVVAPSLSSQATFTIFPGTTGAFGLSGDGSTVLLNDAPSGTTWLWTAAGGMVPMSPIQSVSGLSEDGSTVIGNQTVAGKKHAFVGTLAGGWTDLGGLPGEPGCGASLSSGYAVSGDGSVSVGLGWVGCKGRAFRWTSATGMVELPQEGPNSSRANGISADGQVIGGWDEAVSGFRRPSIWAADGTETVLAELPGEVYHLSTDGSVAGGSMNTGGMFSTAFVWSSAVGFIDLGLLNPPVGFFDASWVNDMTDDGSLAVGWSGGGSPFDPGDAFVWTPGLGMQELRQLLIDQGVTTIPADLTISRAWALSADGTTVVGQVFNPATFGNTGFIATFAPPSNPWVDLGNGLAGTNGTPLLTPSGSLAANTPVGLLVSGSLASTSAAMVMGLTQIDAPFKGGVLVPNPDVVILGFPVSAEGNLEINAVWPSGVPAGVSFFTQFWITDAVGPAGFSATNAVSGTTP